MGIYLIILVVVIAVVFMFGSRVARAGRSASENRRRRR